MLSPIIRYQRNILRQTKSDGMMVVRVSREVGREQSKNKFNTIWQCKYNPLKKKFDVQQ